MVALPFGGSVLVVLSVALALMLPYCHPRTERLVFGIHLSGVVAIVTVARLPGVRYTTRMTVVSGVVLVMALAFGAHCVHCLRQPTATG